MTLIRKSFVYTTALIGGLSLTTSGADSKVDFVKEIKPLLESACLSCHNEKDPKGELRLDTKAAAMEGGDYGKVIIPGKPDDSSLYYLTILDPDDDDIMPPKGDPLTGQQTDLLKRWIEEGAEWPDDVTLEVQSRIDFVKHVQPILEVNCLGCHRPGEAEGGLRLDQKSEAFKPSDHGRPIVPGKSSASLLYTSTILPEDHNDLMPPVKKGGPLPKKTTDILKMWIDQGAIWPDGITLVPRKAEVKEDTSAELALVTEIHQRILAANEVTAEGDMKAYETRIPGSSVSYSMVPIPGGEFTLGSPAGEKDRKEDEGPQVQVKIAPFWMGKHEVTWNEFELFMYPAEEKKLRTYLGANPELDKMTDIVARPTQPYVEMSFGMGKDGYPAISMTQHAANKYCQWLSAKTGHFYRLPTEAEWEYACRAGTTTAYSWGDDASQMDDYAWHAANSDWKYQKVGKKKPNAWGLYDMHGNVAEWCLDQYFEDSYERFGDNSDNPFHLSTTLYPRVARGGSWDHDPQDLRSAARMASGPDWKIQDPQLPKSIWYHTDAQFLGLRVVRPLDVPSPEELDKYWTSRVEGD